VQKLEGRQHMKDIFVKIVAFSIVGLGILAVGILLRIFGRDDPEDDIHDTEEQHEDSKKD
jgi:hypothetical protein